MPKLNIRPVYALFALVTVIGAFFAPMAAGVAATGNARYIVEFTDEGLVSNRITVPAGEVVTLVIKNSSKSPIEMESPRLHIEKILKAGASVEVTLNRLAKGSYPFFDEFHEDLSRGEIVAE